MELVKQELIIRLAKSKKLTDVLREIDQALL